MTFQAFKGFSKQEDGILKCRDYEFRIKKTHQTFGEIEICRSGFHACRSLKDVFSYYSKKDSLFAQVSILGTVKEQNDKLCTNKMRVDHLLNGEYEGMLFVNGECVERCFKQGCEKSCDEFSIWCVNHYDPKIHTWDPTIGRVGYISMYDETESRVVEIVRILLEKSERTRGRENKMKVIRKLFNVLLENRGFIFNHSKFEIKVQKKFHEFIVEDDWEEMKNIYYNMFGCTFIPSLSQLPNTDPNPDDDDHEGPRPSWWNQMSDEDKREYLDDELDWYYFETPITHSL
ncbi:hypothetical protein N9189_04415 [Pirellulaceae bacterium]|nr:hypothetical protein [Pirellulaceae bacterium]